MCVRTMQMGDHSVTRDKTRRRRSRGREPSAGVLAATSPGHFDGY
jgi:hypothetical protein